MKARNLGIHWVFNLGKPVNAAVDNTGPLWTSRALGWLHGQIVARRCDSRAGAPAGDQPVASTSTVTTVVTSPDR